MKIDRSSPLEYGNCLKALTNEELTREVWMLDEHVKYLHTIGESTSDEYNLFLRMAKEEKELRMVSQGYQ